MLILLLWPEFPQEEPLFREIHLLKKSNPKIDCKMGSILPNLRLETSLKHKILNHQWSEWTNKMT